MLNTIEHQIKLFLTDIASVAFLVLTSWLNGFEIRKIALDSNLTW